MPGKPCPPGCQCGRHDASKRPHKANCQCDIHRGTDKRTRCRCTHSPSAHDEFGCTVCAKVGKECFEYQGQKPFSRPVSGKDIPAELKSLGFIQHNGDLATCSFCFMPQKIGLASTASAIFNARAHIQICTRAKKSDARKRLDRAG